MNLIVSSISESDTKVVSSLLDMIESDKVLEGDMTDDPAVRQFNLTGIGIIAYGLVTKIASNIAGSSLGAHNIAWISGKDLNNSLNRFKALNRISVQEFMAKKEKLRYFINSSNRNELYIVVSKPTTQKGINVRSEYQDSENSHKISIGKFASLLATEIAKATDYGTSDNRLIEVMDLTIDTTTFYIVRII